MLEPKVMAAASSTGFGVAWSAVVEALRLPLAPENAGPLLQRIYLDLLYSYERVHHPGYSPVDVPACKATTQRLIDELARDRSKQMCSLLQADQIAKASHTLQFKSAQPKIDRKSRNNARRRASRTMTAAGRASGATSASTKTGSSKDRKKRPSLTSADLLESETVIYSKPSRTLLAGQADARKRRAAQRAERRLETPAEMEELALAQQMSLTAEPVQDVGEGARTTASSDG